MTLHAPSGLPIVLMERFEGLTSAVDCKGDDGAMSLTFSSKEAYEYALRIWGYINEDDDKQFLLIANHDGCGPADERQPYKSIPQSKKLRPRGFWGDIANVGKDVLDAAQGDFDETKSVTFGVNVGKSGEKTNIYTDDKGRFSIDCIDCYVAGSWQVQGHIVVENFVLQDLTLAASPSNFKAKLELEATVTASKSPATLQNSKELFSAPIPGAGIAVTGIFKLGATVSYEVGTSATFAGTATAQFGLGAGLPNDAKVVADINNPTSSSATGWQGSSLTPNFQVTKLDASITLAAFSQPKLAFGVELVKVGNVDVAVTMKLPEISSTLSATYDPKGVCPSSTSKTGVKLENKATESLSLQIDLDLGDNNKKPSWSKTLLEYSQPLGDACFPLNIPGLGPADSSSTAAAPSGTSGPTPTTCSPPGETGICQKTSTACAGGAYISGYCPGDDSVRCCPNAPKPSNTPPQTCAPPGKTGICQKTSTACPGGAYISGYCPGDDSVKCCPNAASASAPKTCAPPGKTGVCQKTSETCAGGAYISGYCPGDDSVKCCPNPTTPVGSCKMRRDRFGKRVIAC
ncbi:MAG: hypothetical protein Q9182_007116 [Xanthomendoza sp. 2 TL-2023]